MSQLDQCNRTVRVFGFGVLHGPLTPWTPADLRDTAPLGNQHSAKDNQRSSRCCTTYGSRARFCQSTTPHLKDAVILVTGWLPLNFHSSSTFKLALVLLLRYGSRYLVKGVQMRKADFAFAVASPSRYFASTGACIMRRAQPARLPCPIPE